MKKFLFIVSMFLLINGCSLEVNSRDSESAEDDRVYESIKIECSTISTEHVGLSKIEVFNKNVGVIRFNEGDDRVDMFYPINDCVIIGIKKSSSEDGPKQTTYKQSIYKKIKRNVY